MNEEQRREFWWNTVTGPHAVVLEASAALRDGWAVALKGGREAAWRGDMRHAIERTFKENMSSEEVLVHVLDGDETITPGEIGRMLLEMFASPRLRSGYRSRSKTSVQEYLVKNAVLRNRLLWVQAGSEAARQAWQTFVRSYPARGISDGLFVLEMGGGCVCEDAQKLKTIDLMDRISISDLKLLNTFLLPQRFGYSDSWREYVSSVAASVCYPDVALSAQMVEAADLRSSTAADALAELSERYRFDDFPEEHAISLVRHGGDDELERRVWRAQVQTLFPLIEMERVDIIEAWRPNVERALREVNLEQYGTPIERPEDLELGVLWFCMTHLKPDGEYILYLPSQDVRERIHFLQRCRNKLAHLGALDTPELVELLDGTGTEGRTERGGASAPLMRSG